MCIVACKYFKDTGWVAVKNRDRNYKPIIHIKQSYRNDIERMYIWDEKTKYTEGINEYGVAILSAATATKKDEKEGSTGADENRVFFSPDGKKVRTALLEKTPEKVLDKLIELQLPGNTAIYTKEKMYFLEGAFLNNEKNEEDYEFKFEEIAQDQTIVRTNHGVWLEKSGYQKGTGDPKEEAARLSSETRLEKTRKAIKKVEKGEDMLDCISDLSSDKNPQLNPLRTAKTHGKSILVTTGQLMIIPGNMTLYYRPIWCSMDFDFDKLDSPKSKTFFQIVSARKLIGESFKAFVRSPLTYK